MDGERGIGRVSPQEAGLRTDTPTLRFSPAHADKLFGNNTVRSLLESGGVTFPNPNEKGHIEASVHVPVSVLNSIVDRNESRQLGAHDFWGVQHAVQQEVLNTVPLDSLLNIYNRALTSYEKKGEEVTEDQRKYINNIVNDSGTTRKKYEAIGFLNRRLLPLEFELPDMEEFDETISKLNSRAAALGILIGPMEE